MADREDGQHQAPLHLGAAREEFVGVAHKRGHCRKQQEGVDRYEDDEHAIPCDAEQVVVIRQHDEEGEEERVVIAAPRGRQRPELAQRHEREQGEEHDGCGRAEHDRAADDQHHHPPGAGAGIEVAYGGDGFGLGRAALQLVADDRGDRQQRDDAGQNSEQGLLHGRTAELGLVVLAGGAETGRTTSSASTAARARLRNVAFSSPGSRRSGAPKRAVQVMGTGSMLPLGRIRLRLSR